MIERSQRWKIFNFFALIIVASFSGEAAEIRFRPECYPAGPIIKLADVAEIVDGAPTRIKQLAEIRLFPAPSKYRVVRVSDVMTVLSFHEIDDCTFTGTKVIRIQATESSKPDPDTIKLAQRRVQDAIAHFIEANADEKLAWNVKASFDDRHVQLIAANDSRLSVDGGKSPWVGRQHMDVWVETASGKKRIDATAEVTATKLVAFAKMPITRGSLVQPSQVELRPAPSRSSVRDLVYRVEDIVGKEATRPIIPDRPIGSTYVRPRRLVRRGEQVVVVAVAAGVRVKTLGIVSQDGAMGDLVMIQTPDKKDQYLARVVAFQKVEVLAGGSQVRR